MKKLLILFLIAFSFANSKGQWNPIPGPYLESNYVGMSFFNNILINNGLLYANIERRVYLSYNKGESWMKASGTDGLQVSRIACFDSFIYKGTPGGGLYYSDNYGSTYNHAKNNIPEDAYITALFANNSVILAANQLDKVYYSTDNGYNWLNTNGIDGILVYCFVSDGLNIYAGSSNGIYKSSDNGKNWENVFKHFGIHTMSVSDSLIFGIDGYEEEHIFLSSNNGIKWDTVNSEGLKTNGFSSLISSNGYLYVASNWDGTFRSDDLGKSWKKITSANVTAIAAKGDTIYAGLQDGLTISNNKGDSWHQDIKTFNLDIKSVAVAKSFLMTTTNVGINTTSDNGLSWDRNLISMNVFETFDSIVYIGGDYGFSRSFSYGNNFSWENIYGLPERPQFTDIESSGKDVFASLYNHGVYFSNDFGKNWSASGNGLNDFELNGVIVVDSTVFAASKNKGIQRSTDYGINWEVANTGLLDTNTTCLAYYKNCVYAGTGSSGIFKSTDNGSTWVQLQNEFSNSKILYLYAYGVNIFAGVEGKGFYMSPNDGIDWLSFNEGLLNYNINSIAENNTDIYLGTKGGAIWKRELNELPLALSVKDVKLSEKTICEGTSSTIEAYVIGGRPPYQFKWSDGSTTPSIVVYPRETTTYTLTVSDANLTTATYDVKIWVKPKPIAPVLELVRDTLVSNYGSGNIWILDGEIIYSLMSNKLVTTTPGKYGVKVMVNGCTSDISNLIIVDLKDIAENRTFKIFPNPANDKLNVEVNEDKIGSLFSLINLSGLVILRQELKNNKTMIDIKNLKTGIYVAKIENKEFLTFRKILKE